MERTGKVREVPMEEGVLSKVVDFTWMERASVHILRGA